MLKYIASIAVAALLLGIALRSQGDAGADEGADSDSSGTPGELVTTGDQPVVESLAAANGGHDVTVRHRLAGSVSRATLVYETPAGETKTVATQTDCQRSLEAGDEPVDGYAAHVHLRGHVPDDAQRLRLVLEDDTGTKIYPLRRG